MYIRTFMSILKNKIKNEFLLTYKNPHMTYGLINFWKTLFYFIRNKKNILT